MSFQNHVFYQVLSLWQQVFHGFGRHFLNRKNKRKKFCADALFWGESYKESLRPCEAVERASDNIQEVRARVKLCSLLSYYTCLIHIFVYNMPVWKMCVGFYEVILYLTRFFCSVYHLPTTSGLWLFCMSGGLKRLGMLKLFG